MTGEHDKTLGFRDSDLFGEVVKQPNGKPGRYPGQKMLMDNNQQGMGWVAVIMNDQPPTTLTPTYARVGTGNFVGAGFGKNDMYKYLDGTKIQCRSLGPDRFFDGHTTPTRDGPQTQGTGGAKGLNTFVPCISKRLR